MHSWACQRAPSIKSFREDAHAWDSRFPPITRIPQYVEHGGAPPDDDDSRPKIDSDTPSWSEWYSITLHPQSVIVGVIRSLLEETSAFLGFPSVPGIPTHLWEIPFLATAYPPRRIHHTYFIYMFSPVYINVILLVASKSATTI